MTKRIDTDFVVIGGGIFGVYAALYLAGKGARVHLLEKEKALFRKASIVNQARLHSGYHYPRSVATAVMSDDNKARFTAEHKAFINFKFDKFYAIDKFGSFTDSVQFQRFCEYISLRCEPVTNDARFDFRRIDRLFSTEEYTFDPLLIAAWYEAQLAAQPLIKVCKHTAVKRVEKTGQFWEIHLSQAANGSVLRTSAAINATYAGSNAINRLFGAKEIDLQHEISEMAFVASPALQNMGLTVMDGQFGSIMPYGKSGLLSLSSVAYTHHKVSYNNLPTFDCQNVNTACRPDFVSICNECIAKPPSAYRKMMAQMGQYFSSSVQWQYFYSMFTVKSKLRANYIDDGRPTEISQLHAAPDFYCIFAGKINSIYEIEKMIPV